MSTNKKDQELKGDQWISNIIGRSQEIVVSSLEQEVISTLIDSVYAIFDNNSERKLALAAAFDLVVTAEYYRNVGHVNWIYCPAENPPLLIYPYTNVCPRCALSDTFFFHKANKPKSGVIGSKTSRLLASFLQTLFLRNGHPVSVLKGVEPVDIVLIDDRQVPTSVMFAEIKAAPLITIPISCESQILTTDQDGTIVPTGHRISDHTGFYGSNLSLFLPSNKYGSEWQLIPFGICQDANDEAWAFRSLLELVQSDTDFIRAYVEFWKQALQSYEEKSQTGVFWLTNACGQPSPRPADWPRRSRASGFESISDGKTSVGMDRTDDLKKATYQALKIGAEGNPSTEFHFRVGIISNVHAVRHHNEYLTVLEDIVWTHDEGIQAMSVGDLPPDAPIFNLFDGIISLTQPVARDSWVQTIFDF